ncbi:hypothetical protein AB0N24_04740 [Arthrobacter sp. NPDC093128]|uniref:hypothetical protein n=1 Tax=Arthrobacter sp. NPDC093128 TaxID=3154979 RepID=UPI003423EC25
MASLSLHTIRTLGQDFKKLEARLDGAVAAARADGISGQNIGRAFVISRQGAQKRWDAFSLHLYIRKAAERTHAFPSMFCPEALPGTTCP